MQVTKDNKNRFFSSKEERKNTHTERVEKTDVVFF